MRTWEGGLRDRLKASVLEREREPVPCEAVLSVEDEAAERLLLCDAEAEQRFRVAHAHGPGEGTRAAAGSGAA